MRDRIKRFGLSLFLLLGASLLVWPWGPRTRGPKIKLIAKRPFYEQCMTNWCWAASGEMAMGSFGIRHRQCEQVQCIQGPKPQCCTCAEDQCSPTVTCGGCDYPGVPVIDYYGFELDRTKALKFQQLVRQFEADKPVVFSWRWLPAEHPKSVEHYMVAVGYAVIMDQEYVFVHDPERRRRMLTYQRYVEDQPKYEHDLDRSSIKVADPKANCVEPPQ